MNNFGQFTSSNHQFQIEQSRKPDHKVVPTAGNQFAIKLPFNITCHSMQTSSNSILSESVRISREEFLREFSEGSSTTPCVSLGKRTDYHLLEDGVLVHMKSTSSSGSSVALSDDNHPLQELAPACELRERFIAADDHCSLTSLKESTFLRALSSPIESTKALLKHFLYESIASSSFNVESFRGLSTQVQALVKSFFKTHLGGLQQQVLQSQLDKETPILLEDLLQTPATLSAEIISCRRLFKLSVMLSCYIEGLKKQLSKSAIPVDNQTAIKALYSALHEGGSEVLDAESKHRKVIKYEQFNEFVQTILSRTVDEHVMMSIKDVLTVKLLSKFKKLPKKPLRAEYNHTISKILSYLIDDCQNFQEILESLQEDRQDKRVFLPYAVDPEWANEDKC
jgi:hypothetical protein